MVDSSITFTPNLHLAKLPANYRVWAQIMNDNLTMLDAAVTAFVQFSALRGPWSNSTHYLVGETVVDPETAVLWTAQIDHVSAAIPTTFLEDSTAHPGYWSLANAPASQRGVWTGPGTSYNVSDFVLADGVKFAMCVIQHVSGASFDADVALGRWVVLVDLSAAGSLVLPILSGLIDAKKFVSTTPDGTAYQIIDGIEAMARLQGVLPIIKGGTGQNAGNGTGLPVFTDSPALAGTPTATTAAVSDDSTRIATTEFVKDALAAGASISVGDTPPVGPAANQLWWNSNAGVGGGTLYIWYNDGDTTQWVPASAPAGAGSVVQTVSFQTVAIVTGTTLTPFDNTIPQITEGTEFLTCAITPKSATSKLVITVMMQLCGSTALNIAYALHQDAVANALNVNAINASANGVLMPVALQHTMTSGTTSATTFRVRVGPGSAGTVTMNGGFSGAGTAIFGGVMASSIVIQEVL